MIQAHYEQFRKRVITGRVSMLSIDTAEGMNSAFGSLRKRHLLSKGHFFSILAIISLTIRLNVFFFTANKFSCVRRGLNLAFERILKAW